MKSTALECVVLGVEKNVVGAASVLDKVRPHAQFGSADFVAVLAGCAVQVLMRGQLHELI